MTVPTRTLSDLRAAYVSALRDALGAELVSDLPAELAQLHADVDRVGRVFVGVLSSSVVHVGRQQGVLDLLAESRVALVALLPLLDANLDAGPPHDEALDLADRLRRVVLAAWEDLRPIRWETTLTVETDPDVYVVQLVVTCRHYAPAEA